MDYEFSYSDDIHTGILCNVTNLTQIYGVIKEEGPERAKLVQLTRKIRALPGDENKNKRDKFKNQLPYVTFGGRFDYRCTDIEKKVADLTATICDSKISQFKKNNAEKALQYIRDHNAKGLIKASGLFCVDIDGHDNRNLINSENIEEWKSTFAGDGDLGTLLVFRSPSGDGIKLVIEPTPKIETAQDHKDAFPSIQNYLRQTYGIEADESRDDITGACYLCHDPDVILTDGLDTFDTLRWKPEPQKQPARQQRRDYALRAEESDDYSRAASAVEDIVRSGIDIAPERDQWIRLCGALSNLGEAGRQLFHDCCKVCPKYNEQDNDKTFSDFLRRGHGNGGGTTHLETLFYLAREAGVELRYSPEIRAKLMRRDFGRLDDSDGPSPKRRKTRAEDEKPRKEKKFITPIKGSRISQSIVEASEKRAEHTSFYRFLCKHFDEDTVRNTLREYHVGGDKMGRAVFWQIDKIGEARTARIFGYSDEGKLPADETGAPAKGSINWAHYILKEEGKLSKEWEKEECLFGEHLLTFDDLPRHACLVKDEKTAVIAACALPQYVWIAFGGEYNLTPYVLKELRRYCTEEGKLTVFADVGERHRWERLLEVFAMFCPTEFSTVLEDQGLPRGSTVADFIMKG